MKIYPDLRINLIGLIIIVSALRLSYWQYERYEAKKLDILALDSRLQEPPIPLTELLRSGLPPSQFMHRRVIISGGYDFSKEMILRNRRRDEVPGAYVITPLQVEGTDLHVLVNRGFVPLQYASPDERTKLTRNSPVSFVGLVKDSVPKKFMAPSDPEAGPGLPWVDGWLRVDIANIQKQIPYPLLPISLEIITTDTKDATKAAIVQGKSGRDDMFFPSEHMFNMVTSRADDNPANYPIPVFDTVVPPGRNFGYIFEWAFIALATALICLVLQFKPRGQYAHADEA